MALYARMSELGLLLHAGLVTYFDIHEHAEK